MKSLNVTHMYTLRIYKTANYVRSYVFKCPSANSQCIDIVAWVWSYKNTYIHNYTDTDIATPAVIRTFFYSNKYSTHDKILNYNYLMPVVAEVTQRCGYKII